MKHVVMFSGGIASWGAARRVVDRYRVLISKYQRKNEIELDSTGWKLKTIARDALAASPPVGGERPDVDAAVKRFRLAAAASDDQIRKSMVPRGNYDYPWEPGGSPVVREYEAALEALIDLALAAPPVPPQDDAQLLINEIAALERRWRDLTPGEAVTASWYHVQRGDLMRRVEELAAPCPSHSPTPTEEVANG